VRIKTARGRGAAIEHVTFEILAMGRIKYEAVLVHMLRYNPTVSGFPVTEYSANSRLGFSQNRVRAGRWRRHSLVGLH